MDLKKPAKAGFFVPVKWLSPLCRHWVIVVLLVRCITRLFFSGNKKPDNLEPEKAGLSGSTKWGHQRKAVALIKTTTRSKSSAG
ncbi:hypothetical protein [Serratia rubidaea]|uniref:Uncharacterized protein n=1 Tax=Serratia rubidaea TaxID=61652 RepID=A0ABS0M8C5_SERRU|nr:hypothetical protein [Serratia rubidaea]MBH1928512.1 hypothetical protein [Serratia rubidaea]MDC6119809.1 hypothetical protein [Serratia rubidaea]MEB7584308.1 hypothetical protein [Serratia rubidaea]